MDYNFNLIVTASDKYIGEQVVVDISAPTLSMLEEKLRGVEKVLKNFEDEMEAKAQMEADHQSEEVDFNQIDGLNRQSEDNT